MVGVEDVLNLALEMRFLSDDTPKQWTSPVECDSLGVEVRSVATCGEGGVWVFVLYVVADGVFDGGGEC